MTCTEDRGGAIIDMDTTLRDLGDVHRSSTVSHSHQQVNPMQTRSPIANGAEQRYANNRCERLSAVSRLVVVVAFCLLLSACSKPPQTRPVAPPDPLADLLELVHRGEYEHASELLLESTPTSWLESTSLEEFQLSESQFVDLRPSERDRLSQKQLDHVKDLQTLQRTVVQRAQSAKTQGDDELARRYIAAICQLGAELQDSNAVLVLQLTGSSLARTELPVDELADFFTVGVYDESRDPFADLAETQERATAEGKHILLQVGGNWCRPCIAIGRYMATNEAVRELLGDHYLVMKVTFPGDHAIEFLSQFPKFEGYPHFFVLESDGTFLRSQDTEVLSDGEGFDQGAFIEFLQSNSVTSGGDEP